MLRYSTCPQWKESWMSPACRPCGGWFARLHRAGDVMKGVVATPFLGLGRGPGERYSCWPQTHQPMPGGSGLTAKPRWIPCSCRSMGRGLPWETCAHPGGVPLWSSLRLLGHAHRVQTSWQHGEHGSWVRCPGWNRLVMLPVVKRLSLPDCELEEPWLDGSELLGGTQSFGCHPLAKAVEHYPGGCVWTVGSPHAVTANLPGMPHLVALQHFGVKMIGQRSRHFGKDNVMPAPFATSWDFNSKRADKGCLRRWGLWICGCMVAGHRSDRSIHCAEDDDPQEPDAATALDVVAAQRVRDWRFKHRMEDEADFAFAFESFEAAQRSGGHHLAAAWVEARAAQQDLLLPDAAAAVEAVGHSPNVNPAPVMRAPLRSWTMSRRRGIRLHPNVADTPEAISNRAETLGRIFKQCGALQPIGHISEQLDMEWSQACARLGQRLVTAREAVTVSNAIRTASELDSFMRGRGRPYPPQHVDLDAFLHDPVAAPAPTRALASLRWMVNQGKLTWELGGLTPPTHVVHQGRRRKSGQATAVAPPMLQYLEERVERLHATGEPRWSALLASWIAATGCLRQKHIARSHPRKLTKSTLHCECTRGKQKKLRQGFSFGIPACFSTGWPWAQHLVDKRDQLPANVKRTCGLCFDLEGKPWHMREITLIAREIFVGQIENPETLTSYSWRRWAPSMGQALGFDPQQLASLSDWQDKTAVPENAAMPLHYSGARYALSMKSKYSVLAAVSVLGGYESWGNSTISHPTSQSRDAGQSGQAGATG